MWGVITTLSVLVVLLVSLGINSTPEFTPIDRTVPVPAPSFQTTTPPPSVEPIALPITGSTTASTSATTTQDVP